MAIEITNAATVSRIYSDGSGEMMAAFQYSGDAVEWAQAVAAKDVDRKWLEAIYVVANCYDGTVKVISPAKIVKDREAQAAKAVAA